MRRAPLPLLLSLALAGCQACREGEGRDLARRRAAAAAEDKSCGDTSSNTRHCGVCGHDCLGAACVSGSCTPQLLADGLDFPDEIVVDARFAYVLAGKGIRRVPIDGGKLEWVAPELGAKEGIAVDGEAIYTSVSIDGHQKIFAIPSAGGAPREIAETGDAFQIALDATHLYVASGAGDKARIYSVPKAGGALRVLVEPLDFASRVWVDGDDAVFVEYGKKRIGRVAKSGGGARFVATAETTIQGMGASGGDIVWCDASIHSLLAKESVATEIAHDSGYDLTVRDGFVYWAAQYENGWVQRVKVEGGAPLKIAPSPHRVDAITTDARYVYWAERGAQGGSGLMGHSSGRILRAAR